MDEKSKKWIDKDAELPALKILHYNTINVDHKMPDNNSSSLGTDKQILNEVTTVFGMYAAATLDFVDTILYLLQPPVDGKSAEARPTWDKGIECLMSCIAMCVGLGNIWRFSYTAYQNGGGAFIIPYIVVLLLIGKPMYYLEMALGQFTSQTCIKVWAVVPLMKGIGVGQVMAAFFIVSYYISMVGLCIHYFISSMASELPWAKCQSGYPANCVNSDLALRQSMVGNNVSSSEVYFLRDVLNQKLDISDGLGSPQLSLSLLLLTGWVIVFLVLCRGIKSSGKVAYFLAIFPYVVLITLLIHGLTLDGSAKGVIFFYKPVWKELLNPVVWKEAVVQCFFSLTIGQGAIVMYSSYNKFDHPMNRDAFIITTLDTFTSLLGGTTIFAILGNLAHNLGIENINEVVAGGSTLAFISYPDAIAKFAVVPQLFSCLFFFMLFTLGLGSGVALHNSSVSAIWDAFPHIKYWKILLGQTIVTFFLGLMYVTEGGQWMLTLVDFFGGTFSVFGIAIVELVAIFWIYGLDNFCDDLEFMTGKPVTAYMRICWKLVTPLMMAIIFIYSMFVLESPTYSGYEFPPYLIVLGWCIFALGPLQIPAWGVCQVVKTKIAKNMTVWEAVRESLKPAANWGPKNDEVRQMWLDHKSEADEVRQTIMAERKHTKIQKMVNNLLGNYNAVK